MFRSLLPKQYIAEKDDTDHIKNTYQFNCIDLGLIVITTKTSFTE